MQRQIDDGLARCEPCARFGYGTFCGQCGGRFVGDEKTWRECPGCHISVTTDYCPRCGKNVVDDFLRAWESGEIDVEAENEMASELCARWDALEKQKAPPMSLAEAALEAFPGG